MKRWRRRSDWAASHALRGGLGLLGCISLGLLLSSIYFFSLLQESRRSMEDSIREDAIWAAFQTDRQAAALRSAIDHALLSGDRAELPLVVEAYDILYSRAVTLDEGTFAIKFDATPELAALGTRTSDSIKGLADAVDGLPTLSSNFPAQALLALRETLVPLMDDTNALVLASDAALDKARVAARAEVRRIQTALGVSVGLLFAVFAGIVGLLAVQMRQIARTGRKLALLSERNRAVAARAKAASRAKSTFLATMSHEIRTPLNGIIGATDLLRRTSLAPEQNRFLAMVRQSGHHLLEVITDVLDFSKLESGKVDFELHRVRLPEIAATLEAVVTPRFDPSRVSLQIDLPAVELETDPARLRQVLVNLTGNAAKFTAQGSVTVRGRLVGQDRLRVEIRDTGIGIAPEAMPKLFQEFSQIDGSASRNYGGSGLGLAICKRIVESLGGRIGASSAIGEGSTFWFELPITDPRPCVETASNEPPPLSDRQGAFKGRVLLVEDHPINSVVADGLLTLLGVSVALAGNGSEAVERLAREDFDLVFMDVQMPVMSGIEATRELRARGYPGRIVGLTGNAFISDRAECLRAGMDDFLAKPVTEDKLAQALDQAGLRQSVRSDVTVQDVVAFQEDRPVTFAPPEDAAELAIGVPGSEPRGDSPIQAGSPDNIVDTQLLTTLVDTLGEPTVLALLDDVHDEADALPLALASALESGNISRADGLLHGLKGAAATLGLAGAAHTVQEARSRGDCKAANAQRIRMAVHDGVEQARTWLRPSSKAEAA